MVFVHVARRPTEVEWGARIRVFISVLERISNERAVLYTPPISTSVLDG